MVNQITRRDDPYQRILARWLEEDAAKADYADQCRKLLEPAIADGWNSTFFPYRAERVYGNLRFLLDVVPGSHWVYGLAVHSRLNVSSLSCGRDSVLQPLLVRAMFIADQLGQKDEGEEAEGDETEERIDFLANVIITAVEGGINYWAYCRDYRFIEDKDKWVLDASVMVRSNDFPPKGYEDKPWHLIDMIHDQARASRRSGNPASRLIRPSSQPSSRGITKTILVGIDSEAADCIIQAALFGELVSG